MKEYFLTIRKHQVKDYVSEQDLAEILSELKQRINIKLIDSVYYRCQWAASIL